MYATTTNDAGTGTVTWRSVDADYRYNTRVTTVGNNNAGEPGLIFGGRTKTGTHKRVQHEYR